MVYCPAVELVPTASVVVSLLAAAVCIAAAAWARQAWPIGVRRVVEDLGQRVVAAETDLESLRREWQAKKLELGALDESVDGMLQSVEKKRRRIAALEAKQNGASADPAGLPADPDARRAAIAARARQLGFKV